MNVKHVTTYVFFSDCKLNNYNVNSAST